MASAGDVRTVGIEEELLLVDPRTRTISPRSRAALRAHRERSGGARAVPTDELDEELFRHQLETKTDPVIDLGVAHDQLLAARRAAGEAARAAGVAAVACGVAPYGDPTPQVSPDERYRAMLVEFGEIARSAGTCGMHVHVAIDSPDQGVGVLDRIAAWLPLLQAVTANSPYAGGRDTGHASWRSEVWGRWPSAGVTEAFGSLEGYRSACRALLATGAARDEGMLYFDARLSRDHPTVEVRVFDVCTDPADAVFVAALVRALVSWAADQHEAGVPAKRPRAELLRAARWRAARYGVTERLVDLRTAEPRPAGELLGDLVALLRPWLEAAGDVERVSQGVERVLRAGGATRQRAAFERAHRAGGEGEQSVEAGIRAVVDDLVARSEDVWASQGAGREPARTGEGARHG